MNGSSLAPQLQPGFRLTSPVDTATDAQAVLAAIAPRLAESHPELMRELGCGVLADRAVPAWQEHALRVYAR